MAIETFTNGNPSTPTPTPGTTLTAAFLNALASIKDLFSRSVNALEYNDGEFTAETINLAISAIGATRTTLVLRSGDWEFDAAVSIPSNINLKLEYGTELNLNGYTLTIAGYLQADESPHFDFTSGGNVLLTNAKNTSVPIVWFHAGTSWATAINKAFACRGDMGVRLIHPPDAQIAIDSTLVLANHHVQWDGLASSSNDDTCPQIVWSGAAGGTMFQVNGSKGTVGSSIQNLVFDGAHKTKWCWHVDQMRKCRVYNICFQRSVGFIYSTGFVYNEPDRLDFRLQTPGTNIGGVGQVSLADWQDVCNSGFSAPITFRSNANAMCLGNLKISRLGAYELPAGGTAIRQLILLSGQNIKVELPTIESVDSTSIPSGALDADIVNGGLDAGIFGTTQISYVVLNNLSASNTDDHVLYGTLTNSSTTRTVNFYKTQAAATANVGGADLMASGSRDGDGILILHPRNNSGIFGQVTVAFTGTDLSWYVRRNYMTVDRIIRIESGAAIEFDNIYMEAVYATRLLEVSSIMRGGLSIGKIYIEDCYFSGNLVDTSAIKDLKIEELIGIGSVIGGDYLSGNSSSTQMEIRSIEFHNRFLLSGGVNYSEETVGRLGFCSTSGCLPIIYRPKVVSGLVASAGTDANGDYVQVTPGQIRDGLGRTLTVGRYEDVNGTAGTAGWRFRFPATALNYNLCVDAAGCVFCENAAAVKATSEQGKIILATFTVSALGAVSALTVIANPRSTRGAESIVGGAGGIQVDEVVLDASDEAQFIRNNTLNGANNKRIIIQPFVTGGGASLTLRGNNHASGPGNAQIAIGDLAGARLQFIAQGTVYHEMDNDGHLAHLSRTHEKRATSTVTAAADITLPESGNGGNLIPISGVTPISRIATAKWQAGSIVCLELPATAVVNHRGASTGSSFARINLDGAANFTVGANGGTLTLRYNGTDWLEVARASW